jgi:hypothetical protein
LGVCTVVEAADTDAGECVVDEGIFAGVTAGIVPQAGFMPLLDATTGLAATGVFSFSFSIVVGAEGVVVVFGFILEIAFLLSSSTLLSLFSFCGLSRQLREAFAADFFSSPPFELPAWACRGFCLLDCTVSHAPSSST